jgi:hypothetical protein
MQKTRGPPPRVFVIPADRGGVMGFLFGIGTALFLLFLALRLLPKLVGLAFWLGSVSVTGGAALAIMYILMQGR